MVSGEVGTVEKDTKTSNVRSIPILPAAQEAINVMKPISSLSSEYVFVHPVTKRRWTNERALWNS